jgi:hypothetical protein
MSALISGCRGKASRLAVDPYDGAAGTDPVGEDVQDAQRPATQVERSRAGRQAGAV